MASASVDIKSSSSMSGLTKSRKYLRAQVTRICNLVNDKLEDLTPAAKADYLDRLSELKNSLNDVNMSVHLLLPDDSDLDSIMDEEDEYRDKITDASALLSQSILPVLSQNERPNSILPLANKLKLPTIELPTFSNDKNESLERFFHGFESIINKHGLSEYEKYVYLIGQLHKSPRALVNSLEPREQTYKFAKELLTEAFASTLTQQYEVIKQLSQLKLSYNADIYQFISDIRNICTSIKLLDINVEIVAQYFIWFSFNEKFQNQMINITNSTRPSLDDIMKNIFSATERYLKLNENNSERKHKSNEGGFQSKIHNPKSDFVQTNNLAVKVNNKQFRPCVLCQADGKQNITHVFRDCTVYKSPSDKVNKLKSYNFCSKCSFVNHNTSQCKFKFYNVCRVCNGAHLPFLCVNSKETTVSSLTVNHFGNTVNADNVLLPTFTISIPHINNINKYRVLSDSGSQRNFVSQKLATDLNLHVIRHDIDLIICGFNSKKQVKTNLVSIPILFSGKSDSIEAIVVPTININLNVSNLKLILNEFRLKGYQLADCSLQPCSSDVANIDLVMGPDAVRILCPQATAFGNGSDSSVFLSTEMGVVLLGDVDKMIRNLKHLPNLNGIECITNNLAKNIMPPKFNIAEIPNETTINTISDILDDKGDIVHTKLQQALDEALEQQSNEILQFDCDLGDETNEINDKIVSYVLSNSSRAPNGRLIMALPWNPNCKHLLANNYNLSRKILLSNLKKLQRDDKLSMYNAVFREQEKNGVIERIEDIDSFMTEHPDCSFMPHMGVFKLGRETTKVRVVFLSNLCEKSMYKPNAVSHNNALLPGPCLNSKITTSLLLSRFDRFILIFDISKAFLNIELRESDQEKLLFLWFSNVDKQNFSLIAYKNLRLSFGLRSSPAILMLALYKLLILSTDNDSEEVVNLKKLIYSNIYMDNALIGANSSKTLLDYYEKLPCIFDEYCFGLQQYATNNLALQAKIDNEHGVQTNDELKFFGMKWYRESDELGPFPIQLVSDANTKRKILSSLHSVYDLFNIYAPMLNRAKLFFQTLQINKDIGWDTILDDKVQNEWRNICRQANSIPCIKIDRFVGCRSGHYDLVAFCDASAVCYGAVIYLLDRDNHKISFILAKNKIHNSKMSKKSIPSLECQGVSYASKLLIDIYEELSSDQLIMPININNLFVYTDSMVCLAWIKGYFVNHMKMQKRSVFVQNRLKQIADLGSIHPITFRYIEGKENPADCVSRPMSYRQVKNTNYLNGPSFLEVVSGQPDIEITIPHVPSLHPEPEHSYFLTSAAEEMPPHLLKIENYSSFKKVVHIYKFVFMFICKLKMKLTNKFQSANVVTQPNFISMATEVLIRIDQKNYFSEIFNYFKSDRRVATRKIPNLILQMNLYLDENDLIRVKSKFDNVNKYPVLLHAKSHLSMLIIRNLHTLFSHAGIFTVLRELRKDYWILRGFTTVRKVLRKCITCKKINERPVKLNQSQYRDFRVSPPKVPFSYIFIDYIGHINVRINNKVTKVWLLIITCLWSRAISLKICFSADTKEFMRCLQMHVYEFGLFQFCLSDLGTQLTSGANIVSNFLDDVDCQDFFESHGIQKIKFEHYPKGNSSLGSLVEICVKYVKQLITKSIGKNILDYPDFQLLIAKAMHLINRRPVAFEEVLSDSELQGNLPSPITPEMLLHGRELLSFNIVPQLQPDYFENFKDFVGVNNIRENLYKLANSNKKLIDLYSHEFLSKLMHQAVDKKDRYKPVTHKFVSVGDIVLLVEPNTKRSNYPLGIVTKITVNSLNEVTSAHVMKGKNRETVFRHSSTLIPLLHSTSKEVKVSDVSEESLGVLQTRIQRQAAKRAQTNIRTLYEENEV